MADRDCACGCLAARLACVCVRALMSECLLVTLVIIKNYNDWAVIFCTKMF